MFFGKNPVSNIWLPWSAIRMNTVLVRYDHSVRTKQYTKKKPERKICSESRDIDENDIVQ